LRAEEIVMPRTFAGIVLLLVSLAGTAARAQTFQAVFWPLYCQRGYMVDGYRDQSGANDDRDIVGTFQQPAGYRALDADFLYFRLRLDGSPTQGNGLTQFAWGFELSTDNDPTDYEILIAVDGASQTVRLYANPTTTVPDSPTDPADQLVMTYPFSQYGRVVDAGPSIFGGGNDTYLDMAVPWADLNALGVVRGTLVTIWAASSTNPDRLNGDFACHDGGGGSGVPSLSQNPSAPIAPDPDSSPGPVGGPSGGSDGGDPLGDAGIEGGPGCDCRVPGQGGPAGIGVLILAVGWAAARRRARNL
jgi:MYXO-CTERM domain-containing protein